MQENTECSWILGTEIPKVPCMLAHIHMQTLEFSDSKFSRNSFFYKAEAVKDNKLLNHFRAYDVLVLFLSVTEWDWVKLSFKISFYAVKQNHTSFSKYCQWILIYATIISDFIL